MGLRQQSHSWFRVPRDTHLCVVTLGRETHTVTQPPPRTVPLPYITATSFPLLILLSSTLKMEPVRSSETLVTIFRPHISGGSYLHVRRSYRNIPRCSREVHPSAREAEGKLYSWQCYRKWPAVFLPPRVVT
jgi:hypothetical protein